jgi:hypothetical protein
VTICDKSGNLAPTLCQFAQDNLLSGMTTAKNSPSLRMAATKGAWGTGIRSELITSGAPLDYIGDFDLNYVRIESPSC